MNRETADALRALRIDEKPLEELQQKIDALTVASATAQREQLVLVACQVLKLFADGNLSTEQTGKDGFDRKMRVMTDSFMHAMKSEMTDRQKELEVKMAAIVKQSVLDFQTDFSEQMDRMYKKQKAEIAAISSKIEAMVGTFTGQINGMRLKVEHMDRTLAELSKEVSEIRLRSLRASTSSKPNVSLDLSSARSLTEDGSDEEDSQETPRPTIDSPRFSDLRRKKVDFHDILNQD